jgi:hypothetical protein
MEDAGATPLLRPTKGIHIVVERSRLDHRDGIIFLSPIDGRVLFILPWRDLSYIGTTDTDTAENPDQLTVTPEEMVYLLRSANARFPSARLGLEDVRSAWAGLRPLLAASSAVPESGRSREHAIVQGSGGMISVVGGKLTTYRTMAKEVVNRAVRELRLREGRRRTTSADTDEEPLPGGETDDFSEFKARGLELGVVPESGGSAAAAAPAPAAPSDRGRSAARRAARDGADRGGRDGPADPPVLRAPRAWGARGTASRGADGEGARVGRGAHRRRGRAIRGVRAAVAQGLTVTVPDMPTPPGAPWLVQ